MILRNDFSSKEGGCRPARRGHARPPTTNATVRLRTLEGGLSRMLLVARQQCRERRMSQPILGEAFRILRDTNWLPTSIRWRDRSQVTFTGASNNAQKRFAASRRRPAAARLRT